MQGKKINHIGRRKFVSFWRRTRVRTLVYASFFFPVYLFGLVIPKRQHAIYGSFNGKLIGDNSLYAFEAARETSADVYFISKSREAILSAGLGDRAIYAFSPKGLWLQLTAGKTFYSHTIDDVLAPAVMGSTVVALGHGIPTKKSAAADRKLSWVLNPIVKKTLLTFSPYLYYYYCDEVHSPSKFFDQFKLEVYGFSQPRLVRSLMPRLQKRDARESSKNKVVFAPTFRKNQSLKETLTRCGLYSEELQVTLRHNDLELWIKPHYLDEDESNGIHLPARVRWLESPSLNEEIGSFSALVTDYSSVFFDAHFAGLAVGFVNHDLDEYTSTETEIFEWFHELLVKNGVETLSGALAKIAASGGVDLSRVLGRG